MLLSCGLLDTLKTRARHRLVLDQGRGRGQTLDMGSAVLLTVLLAGGPEVPGSDSVVREILSQVSADSISNTIQALQEFTTRYSYAQGCSLAGDYILRRFGEAGIEAECHSYSIPAFAAELCMLPEGSGWLVDTLGTLLHTSDQGESWRELLGLDYHQLFGLAFPDSVHGWLTGRSVFGNSAVILHTSDAGQSWIVQTGFEQARLNKVLFLDPDLGWAAGSKDDSGFVVRTTNRGRSWRSWTTGSAGELRDLSFVNSTCGWAVGKEHSSGQAVVLYSSDSGASWAVQMRFQGRLSGVSFTDSCFGWVAGGDSSGRPKVFRTTDAGLAWTECSPDTGFALRDVGFLDSGQGWCAGDSGFVYHTSDAGESWSGRSLGARSLAVLAVADSLNVWVAGERDTVLVTTDQGASWTGHSPRKSYTWRNVLGRIQGRSGPDTIWMASAHFDSYSTDPCQVAPGADDDASGVAALVEAARVLGIRAFETSIVLAAFSGEEQNFIGSTEYVRYILPARPNIAGLVNLDMIGFREQEWAIDVISDSGSEGLADSFAAIAMEYVPGLGVRKIVDPGMRYWDCNPFWDAGYRAVSVVEREFNPAYHTPGDTLGLLVMPYAADVTKSMIATLACLARCAPSGMNQGGHGNGPDLQVQAWPNPLTGRTVVRYAVPSQTWVELGVYDIGGKKTRTLVSGLEQAGQNAVTWNRADDAGQQVPAGVYFCRFKTEDRTDTRKLVVR
ncbi:MAG: M28 family peptidase [candidate division WOR-3 bacterium]|nr:MAG: M28 family peptidase [candidate division WOR-3 bacterium]